MRQLDARRHGPRLDGERPGGSIDDVEQIVIQIPRDQIIDRSLKRLAEPFLADPDRSAMAQIAASFHRMVGVIL